MFDVKKPYLIKIGKVWVFRGCVPEELTEVFINKNFYNQTSIISKSYPSKAIAILAALECGLQESSIKIME